MSDEILSLYDSLIERAGDDIVNDISYTRKTFHNLYFNYIRRLEKESRIMGQRVVGMLVYIHYESNKSSNSEADIPYGGYGNAKNKLIDFDSKNFPDELVHILCLYLNSKLD